MLQLVRIFLLGAANVIQELTKHGCCEDGRGQCVQDAMDNVG
jgi:hypothetical protein